MSKKRFFNCIVALAISFVTATGLYCQDWTQFRGPNLDCRVTGFKAPDSWPSELVQVWKVTVGTGDASPVISGNKIYVHTRQGSEETAICLDASTGKEIWKSSYSSPAVTGPSTSHPGPRSTPAIASGKIVTLGVAGILSCFDAATGKLIWRKDNPENLVPQYYTGMSPLVINNLCIVHLGTKDNGTILALDINSGNEKWKWTGDGPAYASPSVMNIDGKKHIIFVTEKNLISLDLTDGKLQWSVPAIPQQRFYNCVSPYVDGQKIYLTGLGSGMKALIVEKKGDKYVPRELWNNTTTGAKWNTPVLKDGFLYGFTDTRRIYCINASTGETAWTDQTVHSDFATLNDCGQVFIGLPSTGNLLVFNPSATGYNETAKYKVTETAVYAFPLITNNNIYVKDAETLIMYKIK
ncbi:MAG TPA: PQQ-like beta-propeller repeat protein [Bacteroidales bacterium]|nr:PQQ-like beta-propeller repeat protein [Bacteroidales bacterium]HQG37081.1 PQQ-like beta-propeller repeat protein [Bacteroidales bacterium]HQG52426.1 PQQ-like beta-propeller repeat protein [Bacteroidales bacterium]HQJ20075.1 PQQ-like beta-propeller repeat protein [Bacteroidales bacterium]HRC89062.1 PQQ-like beta-propeller repeat protein [Bacteroidales bacterium]